MSPRKRKQPDPPQSPNTPSKRTRLQQRTSETPSKSTSSHPACKVGKQAAVYAITGILDEDEYHYLIDWGNPYDPSWQPKKNANAAAVKLWEARRPFEKRVFHRNSPPTSTHSEATRRENHTPSTGRVTPLPLDTPTIQDKPQPEAASPQTPALELKQSQQSVQAVPSSFDITRLPGVAVEVEPRGSLDKEAYTAYHSSLSTQDVKKSTNPHSDSGFEESSSHEPSPVRPREEKEIIVPDSQSLPGSSSYVPTQATSTDPADSSCVPLPVNIRESSAGLVIPASQPSNNTSQRRESEPSLYPREVLYTPSLENTFPLLVQTLSDPEALLDSSRTQRFIPRKRPNRRIIIDSPSPPQASLPDHQPEVPLQSIEPIEDITQAQVLGSQTRLQSGEEDRESSDHSPAFITQAPLDIGKQSCRVSLDQPTKTTRTSVDRPRSTSKVCEAGQVGPIAADSTSDISFGSLHPVQSPLIQSSEADDGENNRAVEDKASDIQPSQATTADEPGTGVGNVDPQPLDYSEDKVPEAALAVEERETVSRSTRLLFEGSSYSQYPYNQLPESIDSRMPPEPPSGSDLDMSDTARAPDSPLAESRMERARRKVDEARATSDAKIAAQKAERMQSNIGKASPSPSLKTELEIKPRPANTVQSPKGPKSPSLARMAMTPKGPLSPPAVGSPLGIQITSPRSARSPSRIPEREPYQPQEEPSFLGVDPTEMAKVLPPPMMASQRPSHPVNDTLSSREDYVADDTLSTQRDIYPRMSLNVQNLGPMEFIMPLSMPPRTQREYIDKYRRYDVKLCSFGEGRDVSRGIVEDLNDLLDRIAKITTHLDLEVGGPDSQDEVGVAEEAGYAADVSEKFRFLGYILMLARNLDMHIAVIARPGQLCDFIETTIKAERVDYSRRVGQNGQEGLLRFRCEYGSRLRVSLLASDEEASVYTYNSKKADLIIAFDETYDEENSQVRVLRGPLPKQTRLAPVIRLVVFATLEHINLCLPRTLEPNDRLRKLLYHMVDAEVSVGQLAPGNFRQSPFNPRFCAEQLLEFLTSGANPDTWNLPSIPPIENLPVVDYDSGLSDARSDISDSHKLEGEVQYWPKLVTTKANSSQRTSGEKRRFDLQYGDSIEMQSKKIKMGVLSSTGHPEGSLETLQDVKDNERIQDLERQLQYSKSNNYEPDNPMAWQSRVKIFDEANRERRELRASVADLTTKVEKTNLVLDSTKKENDTLRATISELQARLDAYHNSLLNSPEPHIRESELLRRQIADLQASDAAKTKKITSAESDLAFTRKVYQEASTAASSAHSELSDLRSRLEDTEALLTTAHLQRKDNRAAERKTVQPLLKENNALKATLKQRERELQGAKLELDGFKRGRQGVQTRGSSMQPVGARSPRGSRGASPAVSGLVPGHHQGGVPMARGPSGLGGSSRLGVQGLEGPKIR